MTALATTSRMPDVGDIVAGKYRVDSVIGHGGMGVVYAATNRVTGKRVALKMLMPHIAHRPDMAERFVREARASARVSHRNVVDIHDVGEHEGSTFLVMELLVGMSLAELLEEKVRLTLEETMSILAHVCRGVAAAHGKGVIHRDLKPDNIFLRVDDHGEPLDPKVLDFGISKILDPDQGVGTATGTGQSMGTPYYMPPEQMTGAREVTKCADVYSIGVVMFRCLTGEYPYVAENLATLAIKQHSEAARTLVSVRPELGEELSRALAGALTQRPEDRYPSIEAMVTAMEPFGLARFDGPLPRIHPPIRTLTVRHLNEDFVSGPTAPAEKTPPSSSGMRSIAKGAPVLDGPTGSSRRRSLVLPAVVVIAAIGVAALIVRGVGGGNTTAERDEAPAATPAASTPTAPAVTRPAQAASSAVELQATSEPSGAEVEVLVYPPNAAAAARPDTIALGATPTQMVLLSSEMPPGSRLEMRFTLPGREPLTLSRIVDGPRVSVHADLTGQAAVVPAAP